jgi:hypothetical protein
MKTLIRIAEALERIAEALESIDGTIGLVIDDGVLQMRDVDRAKVIHSVYLDEKLRKG